MARGQSIKAICKSLKYRISFEPKKLFNYIHIFDVDQAIVQVSLAVRGGYVPEKFRFANIKTAILGLNL